MTREKKQLEAFLFGDWNALSGDKYKEYNAVMSDRLIQKLNRSARKLGDKAKEKALNLALGGNSVLSFFNRIGISIKWEIIN